MIISWSNLFGIQTMVNLKMDKDFQDHGYRSGDQYSAKLFTGKQYGIYRNSLVLAVHRNIYFCLYVFCVLTRA